ncbi:hypothetical protein [Streptomyces sp. NPDC090994]|uniref:hypothetical protein n=1 Tax=Streptomyces sp. NPDC090994 TaxID=3365969 RepID=UPI003820176C
MTRPPAGEAESAPGQDDVLARPQCGQVGVVGDAWWQVRGGPLGQGRAGHGPSMVDVSSVHV